MSDSASAPPLQREVFDEWPDAARALLDGTSLASKVGFTASLLTADANGHLRTSLLGVGELYAPDSRTLCVALWREARATQALTRDGRAALTFVCDGAFYQVQLEFASLAHSGLAQDGLARFVGSIETGEAQQVPYARLTGGITFELAAGSEAVLASWEQQIERLKQAAAAARR